MPKKAKKPKEEKIDGLNPKDIENIRKALRQVWSWSYPRKLCIKRATDSEGFGTCELCSKRVAKLYADHKAVMGPVLAEDYIVRMWCSSDKLQALCAKCHNAKTKQEREAAKVLEKLTHQMQELCQPGQAEALLDQFCKNVSSDEEGRDQF